MLRVGQSTAKASRLFAVRAASVVARSDISSLPSGHYKRGTRLAHNCEGRCNTLKLDRPGISTSAAGRGLAVAASKIRPSTCLGAAFFPAAHSTRRNMSTSAVGGSGASQAGAEAGGSAAAATTGSSVSDATAAAADAAMAASGTVDQAQAAIEAAPTTFKLALYTPPYLAMCAVDGLHAMTGMPYWMTIVSITLGLRTAILPIGVLAARNAARTAAMKPEMDQLQAAVKADQQSSQQRRAERYRQETKALYKKYKASLMMNAALPLVQLPLFIGFFLGLRRMPDAVPEFATGGALWFQDLGAADPYMIFPVTAGLSTLLLSELGADGMSLVSGSTKMRAGMRAMSVLIIPFTMNISSGVFMYWTTSNFYSIVQTMILKVPRIKKLLNFPDPPKKKPEISTAEKELNWLDVFGGDKPLQVYKKMTEQREVQAWFGGRVVREGAPLPPPPPMGTSGGTAKPVAKAAEPLQPQVVTYAVRPKPARDSSKATKRGNQARKKGKKHA